jgi:predicted nucleic acid-binding Zn ribbon protein
MATVHVGDLPEGTKRCIVCGEPIHAAAKKCIHCSSDQNPMRQKLGISTNLLSMSVALVSVLGVVVPILIESAKVDDSQLIFSLQHATNSELFVIATNKGKEPGTVATATLRVKGGETVVLRSSERAPVMVVEPKKSILLRFHKFILDGKRVTPGLLVAASKDQTCGLSFDATSFQGNRSTSVIEHPCSKFEPFITLPGTPPQTEP